MTGEDTAHSLEIHILAFIQITDKLTQFAYTETVPIPRIFPIPRGFQPRFSTETHA